MAATARTLFTITVVIAAVAAGCTRGNVDKIPIGSHVQLTQTDGALIEGTLTQKDPSTVMVDDDGRIRSIARDAIADVRMADGRNGDDVPSSAKFREVVVPSSTVLAIRLDTTVSSASSRAGDRVRAALAEPAVVHGRDVAPSGSVLEGAVARAEPAGRVKGRGRLVVRFDRLVVGSQRYDIDARIVREAAPGTRKDAETIGLPAAGGAVLGAILGGGKGAAIGAAAGGGAGTAVVLSTRGKDVSLDRGSIVHANIGRGVDVRVPLK